MASDARSTGFSKASAAARAFPADMLWGTATSSYQIEGAVGVDGRGPSIWDVFTKQPGRIADGSSGDVACDHFHRFEQDVDLLASLGVKAYRFSVAWPRVFPAGRGEANPKGLDFYDRLVDKLLSVGIRPFATLYHWDLPQTLQEQGGWESRETAEAFAAYAGHVAGRLGDRVRDFFPTNEVFVYVEHGNKTGLHAPGLKLPAGRLNQLRHHALLGAGLATQAVRAAAESCGEGPLRVGPAEVLKGVVPLIDDAAHVEAARRAFREVNAPYATVMCEGVYTDGWLASQAQDAPRFTDADLKVISTPIDFLGINLYSTDHYVRPADNADGFELLPFGSSHPKMASAWHRVVPEALYWTPRLARDLWGDRDLYITENGCAADDDGRTSDRRVCDTDRVMFLRNYLTHLQRATAEGVPVRGYFLWSSLDNFEWADGYTKLFGLIHVDFETQKRTPKVSADYYRSVIEANAVV